MNFKNPKIWFIVLFVIIISIIIYLSLKTTSPPPSNVCNPPKTRYICGDNTIQCIDPCAPGFTWDCISKKCICTTGNTLCENGKTCCATCFNDICCAANQQIINPDGTFGCCNPGTKPSKDQKSCGAVCGTSQIPCNNGQECTQITNLSRDVYDDMNSKYARDDNWRGSVWNSDPAGSGSGSGSVSFCSDPPKCIFSEPSALPWADVTNGAYTYYDFSGTSGDDGDNLCFPVKEADTDCYSKIREECFDTDGRCEWLNILDEYAKSDSSGDPINTKLQAWLAYKGQSNNGFYCGNTQNPFARLEKVTGNGTCYWQDCINHITNKGTTKVIWDSTKNLCTALKGGTENGGIQGNVQCTEPGKPCSSCQKEGDFVNCIKCTEDGKPCSNCKVGQYIPQSLCQSSDWEFKQCAPIVNGVETSVLKSSCGGDCSKCSEGEYCGNCPWGGNDPSNPDDYSSSDPPLKHGGASGKDNLYCYSNGQVQQLKPRYYRATEPPSGNSCITSGANCKNPGKSICLESTIECKGSEQGCYATPELCEQENTCNEEGGWFKNTSMTDCNIFACTTDGSIMDRNFQAGVLPVKNNNSLYDYYKGDCWRKGPGLDNVGSDNRCIYKFLTGCITSPPKPTELNPDWGNWKCIDVGVIGTECNAFMDDTAPFIAQTSGGPVYYYPNDERSDTVDPFYQCWANKKANSTIDFTDSKSKYLTPGSPFC